ncbi:sensor histidine kinase [Dyadobacter psychrophilus]|uniref:histidine kinase n=1 Tax=Dyadobacter psychrophilus TaxID=651661 RepID=A0A1T5BTP6_9BACT|nr:GAF domain-containing sensor histidine kinase [Dyadobacter psychrophilus]SKB50605.1 GAF domain-containing protein [Dyadobacter psychrophilus]
MDFLDDRLIDDIARIQAIAIVPTLLNVICETTGMGFAAVARVTDTKWITCSVRDDIQFGLAPGSELKLETTICHEISQSHQPVVINHVEKSEEFCGHHTPLMYGFQSYISFPIILKSGAFFGTLCAIDPRPADLENAKIKGMFSAFADLISFHLQQITLLEESDKAVRNLSRQLSNTIDENRQYQHISQHSLQEPLRKLRVFSNMVVQAIKERDHEKAEYLASRIESNAERFSGMIRDLSEFSSLKVGEETLEDTNLDAALAVAMSQLSVQIQDKEVRIDAEKLPVIHAFPTQIEQLFYHLLHNAIKFSTRNEKPVISISCRVLDSSEYSDQQIPGRNYIEILIKDNGIGIDDTQLERIFDMFSQLPTMPARHGEGFGLTFCRKIIRNHQGYIKAQSKVNQGTTISVVLPVS